ncbi:MAG TPA: hypothetical protein DIW64_05520 [Cellvibrio sp.]|nr:hypothetical protein [Cellvibrio sp.]
MLSVFLYHPIIFSKHTAQMIKHVQLPFKEGLGTSISTEIVQLILMQATPHKIGFGHVFHKDSTLKAYDK